MKHYTIEFHFNQLKQKYLEIFQHTHILIHGQQLHDAQKMLLKLDNEIRLQSC